MKRVWIMFMVLVIGSFVLHAEEVKAFDQCSGTYKTHTSKMKKPVKVKESKLTSLNYVKKLGKPLIKERSKNEFYAYSIDGKVLMCKAKDTKINMVIKVGVAIVDGETYARLVYRIPGLLKVTYNLHDTKCSLSGRLAATLNEEDIENETKRIKGILNDFVKGWMTVTML